jgi:hypothetical protein
MATAPRIGLACPVLNERAEFLEWLSHAGFEPVPMLDPASVARELEGDGFQALIADREIVTRPEAGAFLRALGRNRPLIILGDEDDTLKTDAERRNASYLARPLNREEALLAVTLALAEGRPARRSPRRPVPSIQATIDGVPSAVLDVSYEGLRLAVPEQHRTLLPPNFTVAVPMFRVHVAVRRVWVSSPPSGARDGSVRCGVTLRKGSASTASAWRTFVDHAPNATTFELE